MPWTEMQEIYEPVVAKFKEELEATGLFDEMDEGEKIYWSGRKVSVIPGPDSIRSVGMQKLEHRIMIYIIILDSDEKTTPRVLRNAMHPAYDALMADIKHGGTCWVAFPTLWHPGFMQWGEKTYVGILGQWLVRIMETYTPPGA